MIIIGPGMVGKSMIHVYRNDISMILDKGHLIKVMGNVDDYQPIYVLCLPTPTLKTGKQDLSIIEERLREIKKKSPKSIVIIRSTVLPGTTARLAKKYKLKIAHVPEFLTESTAFKDVVSPELLVIGSDNPAVGDRIKKILDHRSVRNLIECNTTTAEMIKYTMNSFFGLKVAFGNQIWDVCRKAGADYDSVKFALESHKWGSINGWDIWQGGFRGYGGKCLPKDIRAFMRKFNLSLLKEMDRINNKLVKETKHASL